MLSLTVEDRGMTRLGGNRMVREHPGQLTSRTSLYKLSVTSSACLSRKAPLCGFWGANSSGQVCSKHIDVLNTVGGPWRTEATDLCPHASFPRHACVLLSQTVSSHGGTDG